MTRRPSARPVETAPPRRCTTCGRPCPPPTLEAIAARLHELVRATPPRLFPPGLDAAAEAREWRAHAEHYSQQTITLRVPLHMLANEIDGVCPFCTGAPDDETRP